MGFRVEQGSEPRRYRLSGELDVATAEELRACLQPILRSGGDIRLDLGELEFMDSAGLQAVLRLSARLGERGRVVLESPVGEVARLLEIVRAETFPHILIEGGRVSR